MGFFQKKKPNRSDRRSKQFNNSSDRSGRNKSKHSNMYPAVCGDCGRDCEVPFRPSGKQPVLCFECFRQKDGGAPRREARNSHSNHSNHTNSDNTEIAKQLKSLNEKMDEIIEALLENE